MLISVVQKHKHAKRNFGSTFAFFKPQVLKFQIHHSGIVLHYLIWAKEMKSYGMVNALKLS